MARKDNDHQGSLKTKHKHTNTQTKTNKNHFSLVMSIVLKQTVEQQLLAFEAESFDTLQVFVDFDSTITMPGSAHSWSAVER